MYCGYTTSAGPFSMRIRAKRVRLSTVSPSSSCTRTGQDPENGGRHKFCSERASASLRSSLVSGQTVLVSDKALHSIQIVSVSYSDMYYKLYSANTGCFYSVIRNSAVLNHYTNEIRWF